MSSRRICRRPSTTAAASRLSQWRARFGRVVGWRLFGMVRCGVSGPHLHTSGTRPGPATARSLIAHHIETHPRSGYMTVTWRLHGAHHVETHPRRTGPQACASRRQPCLNVSDLRHDHRLLHSKGGGVITSVRWSNVHLDGVTHRRDSPTAQAPVTASITDLVTDRAMRAEAQRPEARRYRFWHAN